MRLQGVGESGENVSVCTYLLKCLHRMVAPRVVRLLSDILSLVSGLALRCAMARPRIKQNLSTRAVRNTGRDWVSEEYLGGKVVVDDCRVRLSCGRRRNRGRYGQKTNLPEPGGL